MNFQGYTVSRAHGCKWVQPLLSILQNQPTKPFTLAYTWHLASEKENLPQEKISKLPLQRLHIPSLFDEVQPTYLHT